MVLSTEKSTTPTTEISHIGSQKSNAKRRKVILEEDKYINTIDHIIKRDFFPALGALNETLYPFMKEPSNSISHGSVPGSFEEDTPECPHVAASHNRLNDHKDVEDNAKRPKNCLSSKEDSSMKDLKLNEFFNRYSSEDNESFDIEFQKDVEKNYKKVFWLEENEKQAANHLIKKGNPKKTGLLDSWKYAVKNNLYFNPSGDDVEQEEYKQRLRRGRKRSIIHANTRFPGGFFNAPTKKEDKARRKALLTLRRETVPMVNGHKFVRTPSPCPGEGGDSPFMTWGDIVGTPIHLDEEDDVILNGKKKNKGQEFKIPGLPSRDEMLRKLEAKASKRSRLRSGRQSPYFRASPNSRTPSMLSPSPSPKLSPAALKLIKKKSRPKLSSAARKLIRKKSPLMSDLQLRASYSPSPKIYRKDEYGRQLLQPIRQVTPQLRPKATLEKSVTDVQDTLNPFLSKWR